MGTGRRDPDTNRRREGPGGRSGQLPTVGETLQSLLWAGSSRECAGTASRGERGTPGARRGPGGQTSAPLPHLPRPRSGAWLPAEAPGRLEERASRPRSHAPQLGARLSQTNRGGDRVAPTRICDPSRRRAPKTSIQPGRRPSAAGAEGSSGAPEAGGAAAASTARPRSGCCAGRAGCAWGNFGSQCWLPGESSEGAAPGSAATVHRAQGAQAWEPAPPAHPDTAGPRAAPVEGPRASGALHGLSPAIPGFAAARAWTLRDAGFVCSASPRWRTAAAALAAGCLGRWGRGLAGARRRRSRGVRVGGWDLARVPAGASAAGWGRCGGARRAEGGLGAAGPRASPGWTNGSRTGAGSWGSAPLGRVQLWLQNPGSPYPRAGSRDAPAPGWGPRLPLGPRPPGGQRGDPAAEALC